MSIIEPSLITALSEMNSTQRITVDGLRAVTKIHAAVEHHFREILEEYLPRMEAHMVAGYWGEFHRGQSRLYAYNGYELERGDTEVCIKAYWSNQSGGDHIMFVIPVDALAQPMRNVWFDQHFLEKRTAEDKVRAKNAESSREAEMKKLAELQAKYPEAKQ